MQENKAEYWTEVITAARKYSAGISAYCRDKNIPKKSYYSWYAKLKEHHPEWAESSAQSGEMEVRPSRKMSRRNFTAAEKAEIFREIEAAPHGVKGSILRRVGVYSQQVKKWKEERAVRALEPAKRGPKVDLQDKEIRRLHEEVANPKRKLTQAENIIEIQKKLQSFSAIRPTEQLKEYIEALATEVGSISKACELAGTNRHANYNSHREAKVARKDRIKSCPRALSVEERERVIQALNDEHFVDKPPETIYAILLDEGVCLCSVRTMYRILKQNGMVQ